MQAGNFSKALDLSFKTKQYGALQLVSGDLDEKADPEVLQRCADFFIENEQYDKAVDLLAIAKKVGDETCVEIHNIAVCRSDFVASCIVEVLWVDLWKY